MFEIRNYAFLIWLGQICGALQGHIVLTRDNELLTPTLLKFGAERYVLPALSADQPSHCWIVEPSVSYQRVVKLRHAKLSFKNLN